MLHSIAINLTLLPTKHPFQEPNCDQSRPCAGLKRQSSCFTEIPPPVPPAAQARRYYSLPSIESKQTQVLVTVLLLAHGCTVADAVLVLLIICIATAVSRQKDFLLRSRSERPSARSEPGSRRSQFAATSTAEGLRTSLLPSLGGASVLWTLCVDRVSAQVTSVPDAL